MALHPLERLKYRAGPAGLHSRVVRAASSRRRASGITPASPLLSPLLLVAILAASLTGCARVPDGPTSVPGTPPLAVTLTPAASATPFAAQFSELTLEPGEAPDTWIANGLITNDSSAGAVGLKLRLSLLDAPGQTLATQEITPVIDRLAPGETSPFTTRFGGAPEAVRIRAEVAAARSASFERAPITVQALQAAADSSGGLAVVGTLTNEGSRPAAIAQIAVAARDAGKLIAVGGRDAGMSYVRPGESVPFLAHLSATASGAELTAWVDAVETSTPDPSPTAVTASARVATTSQGLPFIVGSVRNTDQRAHIAALVVASEPFCRSA
ncbi:MAG: hypothetical protein M1337_04310, partial [Actinobacteria bacterium]|nr:hypothetical protein [Actinomycetota bacterium]